MLRSTGLRPPCSTRAHDMSWLAPRHRAGSVASVVAPFFVAHSRLARAQSKRRSGLNPAVRRDGDRDFDPQRAKGARAGLSKRDLPSSRWPASAGLQHPNKLKMHNDAEPSLLPPCAISHSPGRRPGAVPAALARGPSPIWRRGNESGLQGFPGHPPPGTGPMFGCYFVKIARFT